jgi:hypothetical protein
VDFSRLAFTKMDDIVIQGSYPHKSDLFGSLLTDHLMTLLALYVTLPGKCDNFINKEIEKLV